MKGQWMDGRTADPEHFADLRGCSVSLAARIRNSSRRTEQASKVR